MDNCEIIFLAMKPQMLDDALKCTKETMTIHHHYKLFVSVLVGVTLETLSNVKIIIINATKKFIETNYKVDFIFPET